MEEMLVNANETLTSFDILLGRLQFSPETFASMQAVHTRWVLIG